ncbi:hypothetical protein NPIL_612901 [Nephila pilipes]|uniref:Uncharacterized protein n=1 Tax=Nephila pilipes TaxID=299642 RepID=A0A8X6NRH8_NEPPI|nr:hypothetical protein NPIL_612901 [Nephila pilipes]
MLLKGGKKDVNKRVIKRNNKEMHGIRGDKYQRNRKEKKRAVGGGGVDSPNEELVLIAGNAILAQKPLPSPRTTTTSGAGAAGVAFENHYRRARRPTSGA